MSGHELIPVDREAKKKLRDVNKYWILATSRKTYSLRLCVRLALAVDTVELKRDTWHTNIFRTL